MGNIVALVDEETALGFRLAGVGARPTETPEELLRSAEMLLVDPRVRLVLLDESLFRQLPDRTRRKLEDSRSPVFIPIPVFRLPKGAVKPEEYVARLMRRAIGYHIKIRR
jgi:vacuolar-type H+-ATPase subunit F/Vma7